MIHIPIFILVYQYAPYKNLMNYGGQQHTTTNLTKQQPQLQLLCQMWSAFPGKINTAYRTWHAGIDLANAFFLIPIKRKGQNLIVFPYDGQQCIFIVLSQIINSPAFTSYSQSNLNYLDILQNITLICHIDDIMLTILDELQVSRILDVFVRYMRFMG